MKSSSDALGTRPGSLREACGRAVTDMAREFPEVVVLDADVAGGTGFHHFRSAFPNRFIQCGIAEQNMVAMAAGLADFGYTPVISTYAVFSTMRAVEMVRNSIVLPGMNVKITGSHVGMDAGPDGATHQSVEDIAIMRALPGLIVLSPADANDMRRAVRAMLEHEGPVYLRTGRSPVPDVYTKRDSFSEFRIGEADLLADGRDVCLIGTGVMVSRCLEAQGLLEREGISAAVVNMSSIKPIDDKLLSRLAKTVGAFVTAEDHNIIGGLGSAVAESLSKTTPAVVEMVGLKDTFGESGEPADLATKYHLMPEDVVKAAKRVLERKSNR
ncbi:MAG: transketolase family protein [Bacteroidetes bacterium]|nr:transketolase family protein [Bacteroidota bacterium]